MATHSCVALINPKSAGGGATKAWRRVRSYLNEDIEAYETRAPGHAIELTASLLKQGAKRIIAVGGDGTLNEVVNGFWENGRPISPEAALGIIPFGTGSDFRRSLNLPREEHRAADIIRAGRTQSIDLMRVGYNSFEGSAQIRYAINLTSFGMGGAVASRAHLSSKILGGRLAFLLATAVTALSYGGKDITIETDTRAIRSRVTNVAVGNGQYHGGGMWVCPSAALDDGLVDVSVIQYLNLWEITRDLPMLYNGRIREHPRVQSFQAKRLRAVSLETTLIEIDGEPLGMLPVEIEVIPKSIKILMA